MSQIKLRGIVSSIILIFSLIIFYLGVYTLNNNYDFSTNVVSQIKPTTPITPTTLPNINKFSSQITLTPIPKSEIKELGNQFKSLEKDIQNIPLNKI